MIWDLSSQTPTQRAIVESALARCDFPFDRLLPLLQSQARRSTIAVTWEPLEPYVGGSAGHDHASFHVVAARARVAGLAWTDGRIMLAPWLEAQPAGAVEVFLAEAAHQVDVFFLNAEQRRAIWNLFHPTSEGKAHDEAHGWFETPFSGWTGGAA